jgi:hypothetical protein
LQKALNEDYPEAGIDFIYATPNVVSEKVGQGSGLTIIGRTVRLVKVLRYYDYIKRILKISFLARLLSLPIDMIFKLKSKERAYLRTVEYTGEVVETFDERFDKLWLKAKDQYGVIGERSSVALNWRFADCTYRDYKAFTLTDKSTGELLGYLVYQEIEKNVYIADCFAINIDANLDPLLANFILYHRRRDVDIITFYYFGNSRIIEIVKSFGFMRRADNRSIIVHVGKDIPYRDELLDKNNWHYLDGDNDGDA